MFVVAWTLNIVWTFTQIQPVLSLQVARIVSAQRVSGRGPSLRECCSILEGSFLASTISVCDYRLRKFVQTRRKQVQVVKGTRSVLIVLRWTSRSMAGSNSEDELMGASDDHQEETNEGDSFLLNVWNDRWRGRFVLLCHCIGNCMFQYDMRFLRPFVLHCARIRKAYIG